MVDPATINVTIASDDFDSFVTFFKHNQSLTNCKTS